MQVCRKVSDKDRGDVGDHAAPILGRGTRELQVEVDRDIRTRCRGGEGGVQLQLGLPTALLFGTGGIDNDGPVGFSTLDNVGRATKLQLDRTKADHDFTFVKVFANLIGQFCARKTRRHLRDVGKEVPIVLNRVGDFEFVFNQQVWLLRAVIRPVFRTERGNPRRRNSESRHC